jgi:hypothetical protein
MDISLFKIQFKEHKKIDEGTSKNEGKYDFLLGENYLNIYTKDKGEKIKSISLWTIDAS